MGPSWQLNAGTKVYTSPRHLFLGDRQITHLICVRLKHLLCDFLGGGLGLLPIVFLLIRKILVSVKKFVRNSGARNGCANFMDAWKNAFFLQEKPMSIKFRVLGGYLGFFLGGGKKCRFYFYGCEDFSVLKRHNPPP